MTSVKMCVGSQRRLKCRCLLMRTPVGAAHLISLGPCANSSAQEPQGVTSKTRSKPSAVGTARTRQSSGEMVDRIKAAVDARSEDQFVVMARTDAVASEGLQAGIDRAAAYVEAGADMIFAEAVYFLEDYRAFTKAIPVPVLANITEFGKTPLFTAEELKEVGVRLVLYPLSAFRAMSAAAVRVYETIRNKGTQRDLVDQMQTRSELYEVLNYHSFEEKLDELFSKNKQI